LDITSPSGLETEEDEWDEDHALDMAMNDMVKDLDIQDFESEDVKEVIEEDRVVGFAEPVIENRFVKSETKQIDEEEEERRSKKGPLYRFRTNNLDVEIDD